MQTKLMSSIEAATNAVLGWGISVVVGQVLIYPAYGYEVTILDNFGMTAAFVVVSYTRSYLFRRLFNWRGSNETSDSLDPAYGFSDTGGGTERTISLRPYVDARPVNDRRHAIRRESDRGVPAVLRRKLREDYTQRLHTEDGSGCVDPRCRRSHVRFERDRRRYRISYE